MMYMAAAKTIKIDIGHSPIAERISATTNAMAASLSKAFTITVCGLP
jgi:hypothetical protein